MNRLIKTPRGFVKHALYRFPWGWAITYTPSRKKAFRFRPEFPYYRDVLEAVTPTNEHAGRK